MRKDARRGSVAKGDPDPRVNPKPPSEVRGLVAEGAREFNAHRFWHAHEAWEEAWHSLRAAGEASAADFVQGMTIVAAGFENAARGKERGFRRQTAKGLTMLRANRDAAPRLGVEDADAWVEAVTDAYLGACSHLTFERWVAREGVRAPAVRVAAASSEPRT